MSWLLAASLLWAFSFGLIKRFLPDLDPWLVAAVRLALATVAFAPWLVRHAPPRRCWPAALALGAVQFGAMYAFYIASYRYLAAWQVALWTVFTPILVVMLDDLRRRDPTWRPWLAAVLAVIGALVAQGQWPRGDTLTGVLLVQASNACFAAGQVIYRDLARAAGVHGPKRLRGEAGLLGWMYLGGTVLAAAGALVVGAELPPAVPGATGAVLLYLGLVPTALGFWLWNAGALRTGAGRLAVANNLKVPLAVLLSWLVFQEQAPFVRAGLGLVLVVAALRVAQDGVRRRRERNVRVD